MATKEFSVRIGQDEVGQILKLKENLDHHGRLGDHLSRYADLGWEMAIITAQGGDLGFDLHQPQELWWKQLEELGLDGVQVNLAVRTGGTSRLLVLEVNKGGGTLALDVLGDWRAQCVAELGNSREQHYYWLSPEIKAPPSFFLASEVLIYGEEGLILAPPSIEPEARESWRWLTPPWESPLQAPPPAVWQYLREQISPAGKRQAPSWEEIFRIIAPYDAVFKALLVPPASMESYYGEILQAGMAAGLRDGQALLGLLWHAPHGDVRYNAERWQDLQDLVAGELSQSGESNFAQVAWSLADEWPDWGPSEIPESPVLPLESRELSLNAEKLRQLLGDLDIEPCLTQFARSVSGQFFQLLATLGEKMIAESCRSAALPPPGLGGQAVVSEPLQTAANPALSSGNDDPLDGGNELEELPWAAAMAPQGQKAGESREVKATVRDFLSQNLDLAEDREKVQMVLFSLKNYVSLNPEYVGLSFRDKLELAGQMARSFLDQPVEPL